MGKRERTHGNSSTASTTSQWHMSRRRDKDDFEQEKEQQQKKQEQQQEKEKEKEIKKLYLIINNIHVNKKDTIYKQFDK